MSWAMRRLDPPTDRELFERTFTWLMESPRWRQATEAVWTPLNLESWLAATRDPCRIDVGIWIDEVFSANVILTLRGTGLYEVHFEARRGIDVGPVIEAGKEIAATMFAQYNALRAFTFTPHWNRVVLAINLAIGFRPDHVSLFRGNYRGQPIEWVRYSMEKPR